MPIMFHVAFGALLAGIISSLISTLLDPLDTTRNAVLLLGGAAFSLFAVWLDNRVFTIYGENGKHRTPYLTRMVLGRLRLHIFWRGDADPDPHDHPWGFWTFPLVTYEEEVTSGPEESMALAEFLGIDAGIFVTRRIVKRFRLHYRPAEHTHRVIGAVREVTGPDDPFRRWEPTGKPIVTIVWTEKKSREWGFLARCDGFFRWVPWRKYVFEGGNGAACEPNPRSEWDTGPERTPE